MEAAGAIDGSTAATAEALYLAWALIGAGLLDLVVGMLVIRPRVKDAAQSAIVTAAVVSSGILMMAVGGLLLAGVIEL